MYRFTSLLLLFCFFVNPGFSQKRFVNETASRIAGLQRQRLKFLAMDEQVAPSFKFSIPLEEDSDHPVTLGINASDQVKGNLGLTMNNVLLEIGIENMFELKCTNAPKDVLDFVFIPPFYRRVSLIISF